MSRRLLSLVVAWGLMVGSLVALPCVAQDAAQPAPKKSEKKERAQPAGRLPAYYKDVVTAEQRDKIYALQTKYREQILVLAEQMKKLTAERDAEIEGVLTAEQQAKVKSLRAEASKKRGATKAAIADNNDESPAPEPADK
jgi:Spy/CpxP family protein refolding chaperone